MNPGVRKINILKQASLELLNWYCTFFGNESEKHGDKK